MHYVKSIGGKTSIRDGEIYKWTLNLEDIFQKYNFDWVIHFAWLKAVWESCEKALEYFDNNIVWSLKLFEIMEKYRVKNIIFSSSATVYDSGKSETGLGFWICEKWQIWNTTNPYWTTKFLIEQILRDLAKFSWFQVINLRYFNPIWAHNSWYIGENPSWIPNNLLPFIMKVATGELEKLKVFGSDYNTIDGTWVRDYIDVLDLIDWHLKAYELLENIALSNFPPKGERIVAKWFIDNFNLWVGRWVSVLEMIWRVEEVIWRKINYEIGARREGDLWEVFCNPKKAEKELWWKAKVSLDQSIENMWRFYKR